MCILFAYNHFVHATHNVVATRIAYLVLNHLLLSCFFFWMGTGTPKVHLSFTLDASGRTELVRAEATLELPVVTPPAEDTTAASTSNTTATAAADAATAPAASEGEKDAASDAAGNATTPENKGAADEGDKAAVEKKAEKPKTRLLRRSLLVTPLTTAAASSTDSSAALTKEARYVKWSTAQVQEAQRRLQALNAIDAARRAKAQAMNDLEAYIYKVSISLTSSSILSITTTTATTTIVCLYITVFPVAQYDDYCTYAEDSSMDDLQSFLLLLLVTFARPFHLSSLLTSHRLRTVSRRMKTC